MRRWNATSGPIVTTALVAANVLVFVLTFGAPVGPGQSGLLIRLALNGPAVAGGDTYRLITSGFVHENLLHIGFNMVLLYRFGEVLERALGRLRFLSLFVASLLAGSLGALVLSPRSLTIGASGAVFGLIGATAAGLRQRGISVFQSGVGALIVLNLVITFAMPRISIGGHLGGLAGGAALGWLMLRSPTTRATAVWGAAVGLATSGALVAASMWVAAR